MARSTKLPKPGTPVTPINPIDALVARSEQGVAPKRQRYLSTNSAERKRIPMCSGLLDYFPDACAAVAEVSFLGNEQHNPGQPLHHARSKSTDHADCIVRHLSNRGGFDGKVRESAAMAWRSMALLQKELEDEFDLPLPRNARP